MGVEAICHKLGNGKENGKSPHNRKVRAESELKHKMGENGATMEVFRSSCWPSPSFDLVTFGNLRVNVPPRAPHVLGNLPWQPWIAPTRTCSFPGTAFVVNVEGTLRMELLTHAPMPAVACVRTGMTLGKRKVLVAPAGFLSYGLVS